MSRPGLASPLSLKRWWRATRQDARNIMVLFRQFRGPLLAFGVTIVGGGLAYDFLAQWAHEAARPASPLEAIYLALSMIFLQAGTDFPSVWYLQIFFFIMPLLGLGILGQGAADFGVLLFNRQARGEAWEVAVADS